MPIRFFTYLIAALQNQDKNIGMAAQSLLDAPKFPPLEMLMGTLINDISEAASMRLRRRALVIWKGFYQKRHGHSFKEVK